MPRRRGAQLVLFVVAAALIVVGFWSAGQASRRPPAVPIEDDRTLEVRIDLNRATVADLETLPGVGAALAARIIAFRGGRGPFGSVAELTLVPGVGGKLADALRPYVTALPPP